MAVNTNKEPKSTFRPRTCAIPTPPTRYNRQPTNKHNSPWQWNKKAKIPRKNFANMKKKSNFASCKAKSLKSEYKQYKNIKDDEKNIPTL